MGDLSPHFSRAEFSCRCGCGFDTVDAELLRVLEYIRDHFNLAVHINSGCRCQAYNQSIGGSRDSQHLKARAADIRLALDPVVVHAHLIAIFPGRYGIGLYRDFVHIDTRQTRARW